jgi:hypothetical protein
MRPSALVATASIVVLAFGASACKSSPKSGAPAAASNPPATETQADSDNPNISAAPSASLSASASAASASTVASAAASASASTPPSAPPSTASTAPAAAAGGELNACSLMTGAEASSLTGRKYGGGTPATIAPGQDQCTYPYSGPSVDLVVIVYAPTSGVSWNTMQSVLSNVGTVMPVSGVGDKAMFAGVELDVQTGKWLVAIQGADDLGRDAGAVAIGKQLVGALASK